MNVNCTMYIHNVLRYGNEINIMYERPNGFYESNRSYTKMNFVALTWFFSKSQFCYYFDLAQGSKYIIGYMMHSIVFPTSFQNLIKEKNHVKATKNFFQKISCFNKSHLVIHTYTRTLFLKPNSEFPKETCLLLYITRHLKLI